MDQSSLNACLWSPLMEHGGGQKTLLEIRDQIKIIERVVKSHLHWRLYSTSILIICGQALSPSVRIIDLAHSYPHVSLDQHQNLPCFSLSDDSGFMDGLLNLQESLSLFLSDH